MHRLATSNDYVTEVRLASLDMESEEMSTARIEILVLITLSIALPNSIDFKVILSF